MRGFTLIELMIVLAVIGILSGIAISVINPTAFQERSRDSRRKTDLSDVQGVLEMYHVEHLAYPVVGSGGQFVFSDLALVALLADYTTVLPSDPSGGDYYYIVNANGTDYELNAVFEREAMDNDGGNNDNRYEVGTKLDLW
jgi:type II secretion system protein G